MKKLLLFIAILIIFPAISVSAATVTDLYQIDVPVGSQLDEERVVAVQQAFTQLLVKLTGDSSILKNPDIKAAIKRADYYVQEYSYSAPTTNSATYFLRVVFEPKDVKRLLSRSGIAFWGHKRPSILLWIAVTDDKATTEIVGSEETGDLLNVIKQQGNKYGLPLIIPLMDVTDMHLVTPAAVMAMELQQLKEASKRYAPNAYLLGAIEYRNGSYESKWQLTLDKNQWSWTIADKSMDAIIATVMSESSQVLSKRYEAKS